MIYVGVNNEAKGISPSIDNPLPIKIGIDNKAVAIIKMLIGDGNGEAKEVYFNPIWDFRHSFADSNNPEGYIIISLFYKDQLTVDTRDPETPGDSEMKFTLMAYGPYHNEIVFDTVNFSEEDLYKYNQLINYYNNITEVVIYPGSYSSINGFNMFSELEYLIIPEWVFLSYFYNNFNNSYNLKQVAIKGKIESCNDIFTNMYEGSFILCFDEDTYDNVSGSMTQSVLDNKTDTEPIIYYCKEDVEYKDTVGGLLCINNGESEEDSSIVRGNYLDLYYYDKEFFDLFYDEKYTSEGGI